jgi:hypothetical protein
VTNGFVVLLVDDRGLHRQVAALLRVLRGDDYNPLWIAPGLGYLRLTP